MKSDRSISGKPYNVTWTWRVRILKWISAPILILLTLGVLSICRNSSHQKTPLIFESRTQIRDEKGNWNSLYKSRQWRPEETAVLICDMWDQHWCSGATARAEKLAPKINSLAKWMRSQGVFILHAPSSTMDFYKTQIPRKRMQQAPKHPKSESYKKWFRLDPNHEPDLPIDDSDGGCDCTPKCQHGSPWTRQMSTIQIMETDGISDSGIEIFNYLEEHNIKNIFIMGVHVNMCVLGRPFGIRALIHQGRQVVLIRDLTDSMYNHKSFPQVEHEKGTELVVEHIEKYWCPTTLSKEWAFYINTKL